MTMNETATNETQVARVIRQFDELITNHRDRVQSYIDWADIYYGLSVEDQKEAKKGLRISSKSTWRRIQIFHRHRAILADGVQRTVTQAEAFVKAHLASVEAESNTSARSADGVGVAAPKKRGRRATPPVPAQIAVALTKLLSAYAETQDPSIEYFIKAARASWNMMKSETSTADKTAAAEKILTLIAGRMDNGSAPLH